MEQTHFETTKYRHGPNDRIVLEYSEVLIRTQLTLTLCCKLKGIHTFEGTATLTLVVIYALWHSMVKELTGRYWKVNKSLMGHYCDKLATAELMTISSSVAPHW